MKRDGITVKNPSGEALDVWVEESEEPKATVVMAHGIGTDKHETNNFFDDWSEYLVEVGYRVVRFDFSSYGKSEGKQEEASYAKQAKDLQAVLDFVESEFGGEVHLLTHSMGGYVALALQPEGVSRVVLSGLPNAKTEFVYAFFKDRIEKKDGVFNPDGVSEYPRSSGEVQKVGAAFWQQLLDLQPVEKLRQFVGLVNGVMVIELEDDEIIQGKFLEPYREIAGVEYRVLPGDHSYSVMDDRRRAVEEIVGFLEG